MKAYIMKFVFSFLLVVALSLAGSAARAQTNLQPAATNAAPAVAKPKAKSKAYSGSVVSVDRDAKTFTITLAKGKTKILHVTAKTKFKKAGILAAYDDLDLGESVKGSAHLDSSGNLIASTVNIIVPVAASDDTGH